MKSRGLLIVVSGFAGAGKGTLMKNLIKSHEGYALSISATTRNPRPGEEDGREYFFISKEEFEKKISEDGLIEHACYCDNYYGTPRDYVEKMLDEGKNVLLEIEIQGAMQIKKKYPSSVLFFVMTPSARELKDRLVGRGTETPEVVAKRMNRAVQEAEGIEGYDFILVNDDVDACTERLHNMIMAARYAPERNEEFLNTFRKELAQVAKGEI